jgi:hypothetical protein
VDPFFQDVHGNGAAAQDFIVERANVEFIAQLTLAYWRSSRIVSWPTL